MICYAPHYDHQKTASSHCPTYGRVSRATAHAIAALALLLSCTLSASAQTVRIDPGKGPHYVGNASSVTISVVLTSNVSQLNCRYAGNDAQVRVSEPSVRRSSFSSFSRSELRAEYTFSVTSLRKGEVEIGPFVVEVNGQEEVIEGTKLEFEDLEDDPDLSIRLEIPDKRIFVGERVPVNVVWTFTGEREELESVFSNLVIRSNLFDQVSFVKEAPKTRQVFEFETAKGSEAVDASGTTVELDGKIGYEFTATRTMVAEGPGVLEDIQVSGLTQRVTAWRRTVFGVRPIDQRPALATSEPMTLEILPLPTEGQPSNFSGAVGKGFSVEASTNRSVVRVGDPISLEVTIRGDGNLESLESPIQSENDALPSDLFQLPDEPTSGTFTGKAKQFQIPIRVNSESVQQLPALPFAWFDPETETYETTFSKPIALQVMKAQVVSADDVVAARKDEPTQANSPAEQLTSQSSLNFVGANLAIEKNSSVLLASSGLLDKPYTETALYSLGLLFLAGGGLIRWKGTQDPQVKARKNLVRQWLADLRSAERGDVRTGATQVATVLRSALQGTDLDRQEAERIIGECEVLQFSPDGGNASQLKALIDQARTAVSRARTTGGRV
ncbi:MAG: hypothetical protein AB8B50_19120 [Pirellulaceae bacterium]